MVRKSSPLKPPASRDLLARAFLDILAREAGDISKPLLRSGDRNNPIEKRLGDLSTGGANASRIPIRPDLAAAAVLTARAIEGERDLDRQLRRGCPVITIATHMPDLVSLVRDVIKSCAFGTGTHVEEGQINDGYERTAIVIARDGTGKDDRPNCGNDVIGAAIHAQNPIVGVAADPRRHLPRDLMRAAECHLTIGQLDASALALVIEAVTGKAPTTVIDPDILRAADVSDLQLALRRNRSPDECLRRLSEVVRNKGLFDSAGPRLQELHGYGEARQWGIDLATDIAAYREGTLEWASIEKGLLLAGPPGVGKTLFVKAVAKSAGVPIVASSVADWNAAHYLSGALQAMRAAFLQARRLAPSILFIDEIDGICDRATLRGEYIPYWSQIVNQMLELLAGIEDRPGVVVIAATNYPDKIDPAIRRAGRLDRTIMIEKPDVAELVGIFRFHLKTSLAENDLMPAVLAARGGTGADVEAWVRRAKSTARRARRDLTIDDLIVEIRGQRVPLSDALRHACAYHEAGHIVVSAVLSVFRIKAASLDDAGGVTNVEPLVDHAKTLRGLEAIITLLLSGRAAEELFLPVDDITVGAGTGDESDLSRATQIAIDIETRFGLGAFGVVHLPERVIDLCLQDSQVIALVKRRMDRCLARAREIVAANKEQLRAIADALASRGYLDRREIEALLAQHPPCIPAPSINADDGPEMTPHAADPTTQ